MDTHTLFIFRRDLRLEDNIGLIKCMNKYRNIIPIFIFTPEQISDENSYRSIKSIVFMIECLKDLDSSLQKHGSRLHIFYGNNIDVLSKIVDKINISGIVFNKDYTPYARRRDKEIGSWCKKLSIMCKCAEDYLLAPIGEWLKDDDDAYSIFTPFKNKIMKKSPIISKPQRSGVKNLVRSNKLFDLEYDYPHIKFTDIDIYTGGRANALVRLRDIKNQNAYAKLRNQLSYSTTRLSAYIKFGCVSVREVWWGIKKQVKNRLSREALLSQLAWREFYYYIVYYYPKVLKGEVYNDKYVGIRKWWAKGSTTKRLFKAWCQGTTGYPVVDAGMRELLQTGYMHNRARLITANFLNRLLNIDWRWGELWYARKLIDYDPAVNNGNWQWVASVGTDPKPFNQRLFNPWLQSKKYDKNAEYIKRWVPELKNVPPTDIHKWDEVCGEYNIDYPKPIVDYKKARKNSLSIYRKF